MVSGRHLLVLIFAMCVVAPVSGVALRRSKLAAAVVESESQSPLNPPIANQGFNDGLLLCNQILITNADVDAASNRTARMSSRDEQCGLCSLLMRSIHEVLSNATLSNDGSHYSYTDTYNAIKWGLGTWCVSEPSVKAEHTGCCRLAEDMIEQNKMELVKLFRDNNKPSLVCKTLGYCVPANAGGGGDYQGGGTNEYQGNTETQ